MSTAPVHVPDHVRTLDAFAAVAILSGLSVDDVRSALPEGLTLPVWTEVCRGSREDRATALAPHLYRLQLTCAEAAKWP